jgi:hypothetical protein
MVNRGISSYDDKQRRRQRLALRTRDKQKRQDRIAAKKTQDEEQIPFWTGNQYSDDE